MERTERKAYRVSDLPELLGIGRSAAYALTRRADFPSLRVGSSIIIPAEALDRWLNQQVQKG